MLARLRPAQLAELVADTDLSTESGLAMEVAVWVNKNIHTYVHVHLHKSMLFMNITTGILFCLF